MMSQRLLQTLSLLIFFHIRLTTKALMLQTIVQNSMYLGTSNLAETTFPLLYEAVPATPTVLLEYFRINNQEVGALLGTLSASSSALLSHIQSDSLFSTLPFSLILSTTQSPSLEPLQYITFPVIIEYIRDNAKDFLVNSLLPYDAQDGVAVFISEGVSGALGGLAAKLVTLINGNKNNKESSLINAEISGAYFGVTGAIRSLAQILGLSTIAVNLFALFVATVVSELLKIRSRLISPQRTRVNNGPTMYDLMKFKNPSMFDLMKFSRGGEMPMMPRMPMLGKFTETELKSDIIKWIIVYSLLPSGATLVPLEDAVVIGAISGLLSQLVRESDDKEVAQLTAELENRSRRPWDKSRKAKADFPLTRIARASIEGATQLFAYEASRDYVYEISPYFQSFTNKIQPSDFQSPLESLALLLQEFLTSNIYYTEIDPTALM